MLRSIEMNWSTDWAALFGVERPLIVEIGFGNADYLMALAQHNPDCNIIGFEISGYSMDKAERKSKKLGLSNVIAVQSKGETALHHLLEPNSVREFHINYPDPWFKAHHHRRRLLQRDTLDAIVSRLEVGGLLYLATDILEYAEMSHELLVDTLALDNQLDSAWVDTLPDRLIRTKYEEKGFREGRPGKYFKYRRNDTPIADIPVIKELDMPHMVIKTPMPPTEIAKAVSKTTWHPKDETAVALLNGFVNPNYGTVIFEIVVSEPTLEQHIALELRPKQSASDEYTLRSSVIGSARATEGLHHAVATIGKWVVDLHPDAEILRKSLAVHV